MNKRIDEFKDIVGDQRFLSFLDFLSTIGPDARTHRICLVFAAMLRYAFNQLPSDCEDGSLEQALIALNDEPYLAHEQSEEYEIVYEFIDALCKKAGMVNERESARGQEYSIAEHAIMEYVSWYNMPWEDY